VAGEDVAVIGGGNSALQMVENLHTIARKIYIVSDMEISADPVVLGRVKELANVTFYEGYKVLELQGEGTLSGISIRKLAEEETMALQVKGVFIAIGLKPNTSVVADLVDLNEKGEIIINPECSTSLPGIFAAGDVTDAFGKRIIIASGEGAKAALAARHYLLKHKKKT
jgi:alkyl hydroperoxide reductase subunit F